MENCRKGTVEEGIVFLTFVRITVNNLNYMFTFKTSFLIFERVYITGRSVVGN